MVETRAPAAPPTTAVWQPVHPPRASPRPAPWGLRFSLNRALLRARAAELRAIFERFRALRVELQGS